jgi:hypothetical protein
MKQVIQKIGPAFVKGLLLWIVIYIGIVHVLVVHKWDSGEPYAGPKLVNQLSAPTGQAIANPWLVHEKAVTNMVQAFAEIQLQHQSLATTLKDQRTMLSDLDAKVRSSSMKPQFDAGDLAVNTMQLGNLLRSANLVTIPTTRLLTIALPAINKALTEASRMYANTKWDELDLFFRKSYPDKEPSVVNYVCPVPEVRKPSVDPDATKITDLENMVELIQKEIFEIDILEEAMEDMEESVQEPIVEAIDELIAGLQKSTAGSTKCASEEQLMELVEQGLLALRRRAPLRNELKRKLLDMDPSAKSIILDADLPMTRPAIPQADTINLRQLLDTDLLSEASSWIDDLVDLCSGYNDSVDKFFDSITGAGHAHVWEVILQKAGKFNVPHPKRLLEKLKSLAEKIM